MISLFPKKIFNWYFHAKRSSNKIALTFDDGPSEETAKILNILKENKSKATFFIFGKRIKEREKILKQMIKEGHEIGNHSFEHKRLWFKSKRYIEEDLIKTYEELKKLGIKTNLFRPPGFKIGINLLNICKKLNKKIIFCDVISNDWKKPGIGKVITKVLRKTKPGSIINFHDYIEGIGSNEEIIPIIKEVIPKLKSKYELVAISKLLKD